MIELEDRDRRGPVRKAPAFLKTYPFWYPGVWAPPALALTWASILAAGAGAYWLNRNERVRYLFRLPFDAYLVALAAAILASLVLWQTRMRPGRFGLTRLWAILLAVGCAGLTAWALWDRIRAERASPQLHALSCVALMGALALAPRLLRLYPYSWWVPHLGLASWVWVAGLCLVGVFYVEREIVGREENRVRASLDLYKKMATELRTASAYNWPVRSPGRGTAAIEPAAILTGLKELQIAKTLPDQYFWEEAAILESDRSQQRALHKGLSNLLTCALDAVTSENAPKLTASRLRNDGIWQSDDKWAENRDFAHAGNRAAAYFRETGRLFRETADGLASSELSSEASAKLKDFDLFVGTASKSLSRQWIAAMVRGDAEYVSVPKTVEAEVGSLKIPLGNLARWKNLGLNEALTLSGSQSCAQTIDQRRLETIRVPDRTDPNNPRSKDVDVWFHYRRIECFGYRPNATNDGATMAAEVSLLYKTGPGASAAAPIILTLHFDVPEKSDINEYRERVMQALYDQVNPPDQARGDHGAGNSPAKGFRTRSPSPLNVSSSIVTRRGVRAVQVKVN